MIGPFHDRRDAGRRLAARLLEMRIGHPVVAGASKSGMVVASEVAHALGAPLDVIVVRKVRTPEVAVGAVAEGGIRVENEALVRAAGLSREEVGRLVSLAKRSLGEDARRYREVRPQIPLGGRTAVIVDAGVTTGSTLEAAARSAFARGAARLVLGIPVSSLETLEAVKKEFDDVVCLVAPPLLLAVDEWYSDYVEVTDEQAIELLRASDASVTP